MNRLAVLYHRLGPYHAARLQAAARTGPGRVIAMELAGQSREYAWASVEANGVERVTVYAEGDSNELPGRVLAARVEAALERCRPDILVVAGWSDRGMLAATRWGVRQRVPLVLLSDSQYHDEPRVWWKEAVKRQVVGCFGAALVAGTTHTEYLARLGMDRRLIFTGCDVVDNDHFAAGADQARQDAVRLRRELDLPERYFLTCARFVPKKNLETLLDAYAVYRRVAGADSWDLVVVGDGPLRPALAARIANLGLARQVRLFGFKQYEELPAYYGLASAFVLPSVQEQWGLVVNEALAAGLPVLVSEVCGCAPDLVVPGVNGHTFAPDDTTGLAERMQALAAGPPVSPAACREIAGRWSLDRYAAALWKAAATTAARPVGAARRALLSLLIACR